MLQYLHMEELYECIFPFTSWCGKNPKCWLLMAHYESRCSWISCKNYGQCQQICNLLTQNLAKLITILLENYLKIGLWLQWINQIYKHIIRSGCLRATSIQCSGNLQDLFSPIITKPTLLKLSREAKQIIYDQSKQLARKHKSWHTSQESMECKEDEEKM